MNKKTTIIVSILLLFSFIIGIYFYPQMPLKMATHWNAKGQVDGSICRNSGEHFCFL